uniref:Tyr recombinase domain-containing protein n=1 Tax=Panagrellus redivivus TaxID=6233 RepID=A0A7E4W9D2_PANRE
MSSTFSDRLTAAKDVIKRNHVATSTAKVYARIEERFETFLETVPSDVPEVDKVLVFLNENFNKSPEGFRAATAALRAFYVLKGAVENPLDAEVIKLAGRAVTRQAPLPRHKVKLKAGEFSEAINFLSQSAGDKPRRMMNLLLVSAGAYLRPGEALSLRNDDIEEERGYLKIQIKKDKTNQKGQPRFAWIKDGPQVVPIREWKERAQELKSVWLFPNLKDPSKPWKYDAAA